jgi:hypothetical protein
MIPSPTQQYDFLNGLQVTFSVSAEYFIVLGLSGVLYEYKAWSHARWCNAGQQIKQDQTLESSEFRDGRVTEDL